jgi:hypothetical protein
MAPEARWTESDWERYVTESPSEVPTDTALEQREFAGIVATRAAAALPWLEALVEAVKLNLATPPAWKTASF